MELNVGMDVSLKETSICVVDDNGEIVSEGVVISEPATIAAYIRTTAPHAKRIGLETGPTTTWLWHELRALGLPVICIDARHAKAALSMQINKSDRNDAAGVARIMQCGWYKEVQVKSVACHEITCSTKGSQEPTEASQASTSMPAHAAALTLAAAARR